MQHGPGFFRREAAHTVLAQVASPAAELVRVAPPRVAAAHRTDQRTIRLRKKDKTLIEISWWWMEYKVGGMGLRAPGVAPGLGAAL